MLANILFLFVLMMIVPWMVGMLYTGCLPEERRQMSLSWIAGWIILWGLFEIVALPLIFQRKSLRLLCVIYGGIILGLIVLALVLNRRRIFPMLKRAFCSGRQLSFLGWGNIMLILLQAGVYLRYMHIDDDDAFYVGAATTGVATDTIFSVNPYTGAVYGKLPSRYVLSPFFSFTAFLSKISGVHAAIVAHVVLAAILILTAYIVYAMIGRKLFQDQPKYAEYFLFFLIIITLFSGYTVYTQGIFTIVRIWQGKAVFCGILAPMICYMMLHFCSEQGRKADWWLLFFLMCACCMVSSMGIMLGAVMTGIFGIVNLMKNRDLKSFIYTILCCIPNVVCAGIYVLLR
ncbi:MAG: hypothetical protein HFH41_09550 [Lachnospiraceae bacterium]|nr:hypothetical protein [Lachnospiraceae bacterium]